jgi:hypothetical protein
MHERMVPEEFKVGQRMIDPRLDFLVGTLDPLWIYLFPETVVATFPSQPERLAWTWTI